jgi:hypothetical protein
LLQETRYSVLLFCRKAASLKGSGYFVSYKVLKTPILFFYVAQETNILFPMLKKAAMYVFQIRHFDSL